MTGNTIAIADNSYLIRQGIIGILKKINFPVSIIEVIDQESLDTILLTHHVDILIFNPAMFENIHEHILQLRSEYRNINLIGLRYECKHTQTEKYFDEVLLITDDKHTIISKLKPFIHFQEEKKTTGLSERERTILKLVALGLTNQEISDNLFISTHTVISHRKNITGKLGIKTVAGLTVYAILNRLIQPDEINNG